MMVMMMMKSRRTSFYRNRLVSYVWPYKMQPQRKADKANDGRKKSQSRLSVGDTTMLVREPDQWRDGTIQPVRSLTVREKEESWKDWWTESKEDERVSQIALEKSRRDVAVVDRSAGDSSGTPARIILLYQVLGLKHTISRTRQPAGRNTPETWCIMRMHLLALRIGL